MSLLAKFPVDSENSSVLMELMHEYMNIVGNLELVSDVLGEEAEGADIHVDMLPSHIKEKLVLSRVKIREAQSLQKTIGKNCITAEVRQLWIDKLNEMENKYIGLSAKGMNVDIPERKLEQIRSWRDFFEKKNAGLSVCAGYETLPEPDHDMIYEYFGRKQ